MLGGHAAVLVAGVSLLLVAVVGAQHDIIPCASLHAQSDPQCTDNSALYGRCFPSDTCFGFSSSSASISATCELHVEQGRRVAYVNVTSFASPHCTGVPLSRSGALAGTCVDTVLGPAHVACSSGGPGPYGPPPNDPRTTFGLRSTTLAVIFISVAFCIAILSRAARMRRVAAALRAPIPNMHGRRELLANDGYHSSSSSDDEMCDETPPSYVFTQPPPRFHDDAPPEYPMEEMPSDPPPQYQQQQQFQEEESFAPEPEATAAEQLPHLQARQGSTLLQLGTHAENAGGDNGSGTFLSDPDDETTA